MLSLRKQLSTNGDVTLEANLTTISASAIQKAQVENERAWAVAEKTAQAQKQQGAATVELIRQVEALSAQLAQGRVDVEL
jgi:hypothetical protein